MVLLNTRSGFKLNLTNILMTFPGVCDNLQKITSENNDIIHVWTCIKLLFEIPNVRYINNTTVL